MATGTNLQQYPCHTGAGLRANFETEGYYEVELAENGGSPAR